MPERTITHDGVALTTRRWEPVGEPTGVSIVLVHGFGASMDDPTVVAVAERLAGEGHLVLCSTNRGHGDSEGLCTLGDLEHFDVGATVDLARADADHVVLVGTSMGAIAVLRHAAHHPVTGVVTVSSPATWRVPRTLQSAGAALLTQLPPGRWLARRAFGVRLASGWSGSTPPVELAAQIDAPHAIVHGTQDRFIRHSEAQKLYEAAAEPRQLVLVERMGHAYMPESRPVIRDAVDWILTHQPEAATPPAG